MAEPTNAPRENKGKGHGEGRGRGPGKGKPRGDREEGEGGEIVERLVAVNRVSKTTKGGRRMVSMLSL